MGNTNQRSSSSRDTGVGMAVGIAIGVALGLALDNLALGLAIGVAIGAGGGLTWSRTKRSDPPSGDEPPKESAP